MTVTPGIKLAVHSFKASSAVTPAFAASRRLWPRRATAHAPITVPLANRRSRAMSLLFSTPGFGWNHGFFTAGAFFFRWVVLNDFPVLYFFHIALPAPQGRPLWREMHTSGHGSLHGGKAFR